MSTLFVRQLPTLPQKIDSRESLFRCKKGVVLGCGRMNIFTTNRRLHQLSGSF